MSVSFIKTELSWVASDSPQKKALLIGINYVNMEEVFFFFNLLSPKEQNMNHLSFLLLIFYLINFNHSLLKREKVDWQVV